MMFQLSLALLWVAGASAAVVSDPNLVGGKYITPTLTRGPVGKPGVYNKPQQQPQQQYTGSVQQQQQQPSTNSVQPNESNVELHQQQADGSSSSLGISSGGHHRGFDQTQGIGGVGGGNIANPGQQQYYGQNQQYYGQPPYYEQSTGPYYVQYDRNQPFYGQQQYQQQPYYTRPQQPYYPGGFPLNRQLTPYDVVPPVQTTRIASFVNPNVIQGTRRQGVEGIQQSQLIEVEAIVAPIQFIFRSPSGPLLYQQVQPAVINRSQQSQQVPQVGSGQSVQSSQSVEEPLQSSLASSSLISSTLPQQQQQQQQQLPTVQKQSIESPQVLEQIRT